MLKRVISVLVAFLVIGSSLVNNTSVVASQLGHAFKVPTNEAEVKIKKEIDQKINAFRATVNQDVSNSFGLNLESYSEINYKEILSGQHDELKNAFFEVVVTQKPGDVMPSVFINNSQNEGYILEKKANGTSVIYTLKKDGSSWVIVSQDMKPGKYIEPPK